MGRIRELWRAESSIMARGVFAAAAREGGFGSEGAP
jgi:hypothetical protein